MDVGNPSNFIEFRKCTQRFGTIQKDFSSYTFTDEETTEAMKVIYGTSGYIAEPHGAVGYLGLKKVTKLSQCYWYFPRNSTSY
jgi:threonine synthase